MFFTFCIMFRLPASNRVAVYLGLDQSHAYQQMNEGEPWAICNSQGEANDYLNGLKSCGLYRNA